MYKMLSIARRALGLAGIVTSLATSPSLAQPSMGWPGGPDVEGGNVVGGATATISGGGDEMVITYSQVGAGGGRMRAQADRQARFGSTMGDGPVVEYETAPPAGGGREAWLSGGGDNAELVYVRPR